MNITDIFTTPFLLRSLLASIVIAVLCSCWGIYLVLRKQSFLGDGVAHASLSGIAIALLLSLPPLPVALLVGIIMAVLITYLEKRTPLALDNLIGIIYVILFAFGLLLINIFPRFQPDLTTYLFGSILSISWAEVLLAVAFLVITLLIFKFFSRQLLYTTFDSDAAKLRGINVEKYTYLINISCSIAVIIALKLVGIVMVTALLLIPTASAKLLARDFRQMQIYSVIFSIISTLCGVILAFFLNTPVGPTVVISSGVVFGIVLVLRSLRRQT